MNFASIDLGTNTFRLLVANLHDHNEIEFLHKISTVCALGRGFNTLDRTLSYGSINRCLNVIKEFNQILTDFNVNNLRAVATSIVRQSTNSHLFTVPAANILNNKIEVISGKNEAELTTLGVLNSIDNIANNKLIVDIGGGSTEFAFVDKYNEIISTVSLNLGVLSLSESYKLNTKLKIKDINMISDNVRNIIDNQFNYKDFNDLDISEIIVTAGTPTTLAAMDLRLSRYDHNKINGYRLHIDNIKNIFNNICTLNAGERLKLKGLIKGRENLIIPGTLIVLDILRRFNKEHLIVSDGGLLEGIIYEERTKIVNNFI